MAQSSRQGAEIWRFLRRLADRGSLVHLQWTPAHCSLEGNERTDRVAKEASELPQDKAYLDIRAVMCAAARSARKRWRSAWPVG